MRRFTKSFNEGLDRKLAEQEQKERVLSAYKKGEDLPDIIAREKIHSVLLYKLIGREIKDHPEIKEARKQMRQKVDVATKKYLLPVQKGRPRINQPRQPNSKETSIIQPTGKKRGRKPSKGTKKRSRKAWRLLEERRHKRIIQNYKAGADLKNLVPGYHTTPQSAYQYAYRTARKNASMRQARNEALGKYTWEEQTKKCAETIAYWLPEKIRPLFWEAYNKTKTDQL